VRPVLIKFTTQTGACRQGRMRRTLAGVIITLCLWASRGFAQSGAPFTIDPAMTKGPATAPVTLVEFSDYQ
jgi:hypothetical protein